MDERLRKVRKVLDLTQQEFADRIGSKRNTVATYEMGRTAPSAAVISLICKTFNVSEDWLRYGTGEMFLPRANTALELLVAEHNLTVGDRALIEKFLSLKPEARRALVDFAQKAVSAFAGQQPSANSEVAFTETTEALYRSSSGYVLKADASALTTTEDTEPDQGEKMA